MEGTVTSESGAQASVERLRVGIRLDSLAIEPWVAALVRQIDDTEAVEIALVVLGPAEPARTDRRSRPWSLYERLDRAIFDGAAPAEVSARLSRLPTAPAEREALRGHDLDVLLWASAGRPARELAASARFGLWWIHQGDSRAGRGDPPLLWELSSRQPVAAAELHVLVEGPGDGRVLDRSFAPTDPVSLARSRARASWALLGSIVARLEDVRRRGSSALEPIDGTTEDRAQGRPPTAGQTLRHVARVTAGVGRKAWGRALTRDQWFLAYREHAGNLTLPPSPGSFTPILPPDDRFYADPHVISVGETSYVFFEDCPLDVEHGRISVVEISADGSRSEPAVVLEQPHHLSYPFVFKSGGETFMIPETLAEERVQLHRAVAFPERWELVTTLLERVDVVDATVVEHDGLFWLFAARVGYGGGADRLELYSSSDLTGTWRPHPRNPIVTDVRTARPAGGLFMHDGRLIRPAQDSSIRYGRATVFNEVLTLDERDYRERVVATLEPDWRPDINGTHCYSVDTRLEVIDARRVLSRLGRARRAGRR